MGLRQDILNDQVCQLDLRELITVKPYRTVRQVVRFMDQKKLGCVVVVDESCRIIGKFTERMLMKLLLVDTSALDDPIAKHISDEWSCVRPTDPIARVIECMEAKKLRFVFVVDDAQHPIGLTGQKGVIQFVAEHFPRQVKAQEISAKLYMDQREGA